MPDGRRGGRRQTGQTETTDEADSGRMVRSISPAGSEMSGIRHRASLGQTADLPAKADSGNRQRQTAAAAGGRPRLWPGANRDLDSDRQRLWPALRSAADWAGLLDPLGNKPFLQPVHLLSLQANVK